MLCIGLARHVALFWLFFFGNEYRTRRQPFNLPANVAIKMVPSHVNYEADLDASAVVWQQHFGLNELQPQNEDQWEEVLDHNRCHWLLISSNCHSS
jgi:hypothetical protein